jgi:shikimate kinase
MNKSIFENNSLTRPIVLIGMMGAGKTNVGRALAGLLSVPFVDADAEIETAAGCTIAEIFSAYGEAEFKRMERLVIARLLKGHSCVLSLGGGAFLDEETRKSIQEGAISVWIKVDRKILLNRVLHHKHRPRLNTGDPIKTFDKLYADREPFYALADVAVTCDDQPVLHNARKIMDALKSLNP